MGALLQCIIIFFPLLAMQLYGWRSFCKGNYQPPRPWCSNKLPYLYGFVQSEYWGLGMFRYWRPEQVRTKRVAGRVAEQEVLADTLQPIKAISVICFSTVYCCAVVASLCTATPRSSPPCRSPTSCLLPRRWAWQHQVAGPGVHQIGIDAAAWPCNVPRWRCTVVLRVHMRLWHLIRLPALQKWST